MIHIYELLVSQLEKILRKNVIFCNVSSILKQPKALQSISIEATEDFKYNMVLN